MYHIDIFILFPVLKSRSATLSVQIALLPNGVSGRNTRSRTTEMWCYGRASFLHRLFTLYIINKPQQIKSYFKTIGDLKTIKIER
uniref:Uncharacterized protein n=1 Tax=Sarcoptes scabiei TaxID=52283 RepID=A0A834R9D4_SARSC